MDTPRVLPPPTDREARIGPLAVFSSPAVEGTYRQQQLGYTVWLSQVLIGAAMCRVVLFFLADYQHFGLGPALWRLLAVRAGFLVVSACALVGLRRATSAALAERLFFGWCVLLATLTVYSLSARLPANTGLLLMSFGVVPIVYCVTPLPLSRQLVVALGYSGAALLVSRWVEGGTLLLVGAAHGLSNLFGAVVSWQLNRRRREAYLSALREAELRAGLEEAAAEIRTLRGLLCICAWCKRVRDEAEAWQAVEHYVASRTHASFTHGICPACLHSQVGNAPRSAS